jgi:hypothetical protein
MVAAVLSHRVYEHAAPTPRSSPRGIAALQPPMIAAATRSEDSRPSWTGLHLPSGDNRILPSSPGPLALPLRFEPQVGQIDGSVDASARTPGYMAFLSHGDALIALPGRRGHPEARAVRLRLATAEHNPAITFLDEQPGVTNYLLGSDPSTWHTGVRGYSRVKYEGVYPGIDLIFYGNPEQLEHDFVVAPGADPSIIGLEFEGVETLRIDDAGDLVLTAGDLELRQQRPNIYQDAASGGRREVTGRYVLDGSVVRFAIDAYDETAPLIIDPVLLVYSTFLGGTGSEINSGLVTSDSAGAAYLVAQTNSLDYPTTAGVLQATHAGARTQVEGPWYVASNFDLVVSKLSPDGSSLVYSTYFGGSDTDTATRVVVSDSGEAVILGYTLSPDFPAAPGYQLGCPCGKGQFLAKLNALGTGLTYMVRVWRPWLSDVTLDAAGHAYLTGDVPGPALQDPVFPLVNPAQGQFGGGNSDAYLLELDADGASVVYSTYLGGEGNDTGLAVHVDPGGVIAVAGSTASVSFPLIPPGEERSGGPSDAFVTRFTSAGLMLSSNFLDGPYTLLTGSVTFGADGSLYVSGATQDDGFPAVNAMQPTRAGQHDGWIVKYSNSGEVVYSTYVGGVWPDFVIKVAGDARGRAYILGKTLVNWTAGPVYMGYYPSDWTANWDLTIVKLHSSGAVASAVRLGGAYNDSPTGIALGASGNAYVTGSTYSIDFPTASPLRRMTLSPITHGGQPRPVDLFLTHVQMSMNAWPITTAIPPETSQRVTILGSEFFGDMRVFIGGQGATDVVVNARDSLSAVVPALPAGIYDLTVVDSYGEVATTLDGILYGNCSFDVSSTSEVFLAAGGTRNIPVTANVPLCAWTAESSVDWISFSEMGAAGSSWAHLTVAPNPSGASRTGAITIAGHPITVTQAAQTLVDVNGDGSLDLIWQHESDGRLAAWMLQSSRAIAGTALSPSVVTDVNWKIVGTGDFDGDRQEDLVWQHLGDGRLAVWLMDGLTLREGTLLTPSQVSDLDWRIRAVGDLNGDGHPDLIWQHQSDGRVAVWFMNGLQSVGGELLTPSVVSDTSWQIVGVGDFISSGPFSGPDGRLDIVWQRQTDGLVSIWAMDGSTMIGARELPWWLDANWSVRATGDINEDNGLDFVVQHQGDGGLRYVRFNPLVLTGVTWYLFEPSSVSDTAWRIVGPR